MYKDPNQLENHILWRVIRKHKRVILVSMILIPLFFFFFFPTHSHPTYEYKFCPCFNLLVGEKDWKYDYLIKSLSENNDLETDSHVFIRNNDLRITRNQDYRPEKGFVFHFTLENDHRNLGILPSRILNFYEMLRFGNCSHMIELHDDMIWLTKFSTLEKILRTNRPVVLNPWLMENIHHYKQGLDYRDFYDRVTDTAKKILSRKQTLIYNTVQTHPWVIDFQWLKDGQYFDTFYAPLYFEDDDFLMNVRQKTSLGIMTHKDFVVYHHGGSTVPKMIDEKQIKFRENQAYFREKFNLSHTWKEDFYLCHPVLSEKDNCGE